MQKTIPTEELKKSMDKYYNKSGGYLNHLNKKRGTYFSYYSFFLKRYLTNLKKGSRVLEIGAGDGYATYLLSKEFPDLNFTGTDVSAKFISYAKKKFKRRNLHYSIEDSLNMSFQSKSFDAVISTDVVEHIPNVPKWLDESKRVLKKGGLLIIVTGNHFSPIQPFLDIIRFKKRSPFAVTYLSQFRLLFYNIFMSFIKLINPSFIYVNPDLSSRADGGGDFDAVYLANQMDISIYLRKKGMKIINISFKGPDLFSKLCGYLLPLFSGMGIVAKKIS